MNRQVWKRWYRQQRIVRRESAKASIDMLIHGVGFLRISEDGFVNHIRADAVRDPDPRDMIFTMGQP